MAISEADLTMMAAIGAQKTSKDTYATVKLALDNKDTGYHEKNYKVFLQGSYGNDTNIVKESDVDVIICLDSIFTYDISLLPQPEQESFRTKHPASKYTHKEFREDVLRILYERFGDDVQLGTKAVMIKPLHNRRKTDVLIAINHKRYSRFIDVGNEVQVSGISFYKADGTRVVNYPRLHRDNLVAKNQETGEYFKHIVRIFKNARQKLIEEGVIEEGIAPSYYIEGLLYNVPKDQFGISYENSMFNSIKWLTQADRSKFLCANGQYMLIDGNADVTWNSKNCDTFLNGIVELWNGW
ncbi:MAG: nucleotidyltransferase [Methylotenera sp.]|nr:nucleotidyltransferase [Methylotenera sp.]